MKILRTLLRGAGQVMFQGSWWTGLMFLIGIFWGSYATGNPAVGWGALLGLVASTAAGWLLNENPSDGEQGLWGFNGILVGCAFPTFISPDSWLMWVSIVFFAMLSTWVRRGFNNVMAPWKVNSFTFPFVFLTWIFLLAARMFDSLHPAGLSTPALESSFDYSLDCSFVSLVIYWLKGVAQVFLVDSWITGVWFLVGLALCNKWAAIWAGIASAVALGLAILFQTNPHDIANGLFGFSPVLTGIALGMTFYKVNWRSALWALAGIAATFFIQAGMDVLMAPWGIPTLTAPFCVATWLFLLPLFRFTDPHPDHSNWKSKDS